MKLISFRDGETYGAGVVEEGDVYPIHEGEKSLDMHEVIKAWRDNGKMEKLIEEALSGKKRSLEKLKIAPCIPMPERIFCIGLNYRSHARETGARLPDSPVIFSKFSDSIAAHSDTIPVPKYGTWLDYEGELAFVIGKSCFDVEESAAADYIFGYFCSNDVSARDLQFKTSQWLLGKSLEHFCPIGPYVVTADSIDATSLILKTEVNGKTVQNANTADMIFSCNYLVSYLSKYFRLMPGDIVLTGTPDGVILGKPVSERKWLMSGDKVSVTITGLGTLTNSFV
ncbi:MAG: fumarylacetoacetate hydrolase family protein [Methanomassiliicoccales archaeon]